MLNKVREYIRTSIRLIPGFKKRRKVESIRKDRNIIKIQDNVRFVVYWKVLSNGKGPAFIFKVHGKVLARFDCFGDGAGHYHLYNVKGRIYMEENLPSKQIEWAINELNANADHYLRNHPDEQINQLLIDREAISKGLEKAKRLMMNFLENVDELQDLRDQEKSRPQ